MVEPEGDVSVLDQRVVHPCHLDKVAKVGLVGRARAQQQGNEHGLEDAEVFAQTISSVGGGEEGGGEKPHDTEKTATGVCESRVFLCWGSLKQR